MNIEPAVKADRPLLSVVPLVLAVVAAAAILVLPTIRVVVVTQDPPEAGATPATFTRVNTELEFGSSPDGYSLTLLEAYGVVALIPVAVPVGFAALPLLFSGWRRRAAFAGVGTLLTGFWLLATASSNDLALILGVLYFPVLVAMAVAAMTRPRQHWTIH